MALTFFSTFITNQRQDTMLVTCDFNILTAAYIINILYAYYGSYICLLGQYACAETLNSCHTNV